MKKISFYCKPGRRKIYFLSLLDGKPNLVIKFFLSKITTLHSLKSIGASSYTDTCLTCDGIYGARMRFYVSIRIGIECPIIHSETQTISFNVICMANVAPLCKRYGASAGLECFANIGPIERTASAQYCNVMGWYWADAVLSAYNQYCFMYTGHITV